MKVEYRSGKRVRAGNYRAVLLCLIVLAGVALAADFSIGTASLQATSSFNLGPAGAHAWGQHRTDSLLVKFESSTPPNITTFLQKYGGQTLRKLVPHTSGGLDNWFVIHGTALDMGGITTYLKSRQDVQAVDFDYVGRENAIPNDPMFSSQWNLQTNIIDAPNAWNAINSSSIVVAIADSGIDFTHPDLKANAWVNPHPTYGCDTNGYNFVDNSCNIFTSTDTTHATRLAGIVGAVGNNGVGVTGIAWNIKIMSLKVNQNGGTVTSAAVSGITYAVDNGAKIINTSWGVPYSQALYDAFAYAQSKGVIMTTSAGNNGANNDATDHFPSNFDRTLDNVVALANTQEDDTLRASSNYGATTVQMAAPGTNIWSTCAISLCGSSGYNTGTGTSDSAPHFAGAAGLVWAKFPDYDYKQVINQIIGSGDKIPSLNGLVSCGCRLNLAKAVNAVQPPPGLSASFNYSPSTPVIGTIVTFSASASGGTTPYSYSWSFGDSTTGTGITTSHSYTSAGTYTVSLTVTDSSTNPQRAVVSQTVRVSTQQGILTSFVFTPSNPRIGDTVYFNATVANGVFPYTFAWTFGDGGTASGATVTHSYTQNGTYTVGVTATDASSNRGSAQSIITIGGASNNTSPVLIVPGNLVVNVGARLTFTITAYDSDNDPTITLTASFLPVGATFVRAGGNPVTGAFSWTPGQSQSSANYTMTFLADDGHGGRVSSSVSIHVTPYAPPPILVIPGPQTALVGATLSFTVTATDPDTPPLPISLSATGLVTGMNFVPATGSFSFTPEASQAGQTFHVTFVATENENSQLSDMKTEQIQVISAPGGPSGGAGGGGSCFFCRVPWGVSSTMIWLLLGTVLGLLISMMLVLHRARRELKEKRKALLGN